MYLQLATKEQTENVRKEFNASEESIEADVQYLIQWMQKQPHLPKLTDKELLSHCLLNCKNSVEKTKNKLETYFNTKAIMPEIFTNRDPLSYDIERVCSLGMYIPLPKLTPDGYRVIMLYISVNAKNVELSPFDHFLKATLMTVDILGKYDFSKGVIVVHDGKNMTMQFVTAAASELYKLILLSTKTIPVRYRNLYFFNMSPATEIFLNVGKTLVKKELANRIEILKCDTELCKVLPKEIVPQDYGGDELPVQILRDRWFEEMKKHRDFLIAAEDFVSDLSKKPRPSVCLDFDDLPGSFRKINID